MKHLHFYYGVMGSAKSAEAVMKAYKYHENRIPLVVIKSAIDTREDSPVIKSRSGLRFPCNLFKPTDNIFDIVGEPKSGMVVIVDEVQFCTSKQIDQLRDLANQGVEIQCYGLKTNFQTHFFEGSQRLLEIADDIHEIESVCRCGNKAIFNARIVDSRVTLEGPEVQIGGDESYEGLCPVCFEKYQHEDLPKLGQKSDTAENTK